MPVLNNHDQGLKYIGIRHLIEDEELAIRKFMFQSQTLGLHI
jgi:hypothetical protein